MGVRTQATARRRQRQARSRTPSGKRIASPGSITGRRNAARAQQQAAMPSQVMARHNMARQATQAAASRYGTGGDMWRPISGGYIKPGTNVVRPDLPGLVPTNVSGRAGVQHTAGPWAGQTPDYGGRAARQEANLIHAYKGSPMHRQEQALRQAQNAYRTQLGGLGKHASGQAVLGLGPQGIPGNYKDLHLVNTGRGHQWMGDEQLTEFGKTQTDKRNPQGKTLDQMLRGASVRNEPGKVLRFNRHYIPGVLGAGRGLQQLNRTQLARGDIGKAYRNVGRDSVDWSSQKGKHLIGLNPNQPSPLWNVLGARTGRYYR